MTSLECEDCGATDVPLRRTPAGLYCGPCAREYTREAVQRDGGVR